VGSIGNRVPDGLRCAGQLRSNGRHQPTSELFHIDLGAIAYNTSSHSALVPRLQTLAFGDRTLVRPWRCIGAGKVFGDELVSRYQRFRPCLDFVDHDGSRGCNLVSK